MMLTRFRDLPIRRKLVIMTLASTAVALLLASGGFLVWDVLTFRAEIQRDINKTDKAIASL